MKTAEEWVQFLNRAHPDDLPDMVKRITGESERKGAEEMRERCAQVVDLVHPSGQKGFRGKWAEAIRALPLPGDGLQKDKRVEEGWTGIEDFSSTPGGARRLGHD